jgi:hypothetical protein
MEWLERGIDFNRNKITPHNGFLKIPSLSLFSLRLNIDNVVIVAVRERNEGGKVFIFANKSICSNRNAINKFKIESH